MPLPVMIIVLALLFFISGTLADQQCQCCPTRWSPPVQWTCPDNEFCGDDRNTCSGSDFGLFRCNSTTSCPDGLECCSTGPVSPGPSTEYSFCRNASAGDTCCGKHAPPCSSDERCCLSELGFQGVAAAAASVRRSAAARRTTPSSATDDGDFGWVYPLEGDKLGFDGGVLDWCVPAQTGQCCNDGADELLFTCSEGKCCGRPWHNGTTWVAGCTTRQNVQCCGTTPEEHYCPGCGFPCDKRQTCCDPWEGCAAAGGRTEMCVASKECTLQLNLACPNPDDEPFEKCQECIVTKNHTHPERFDKCGCCDLINHCGEFCQIPEECPGSDWPPPPNPTSNHTS